MRPIVRTLASLAMALVAGTAAADATIYQHHDYRGRAFSTPGPVDDLGRVGFADRASSMVITGARAWEVCQGPAFSGPCMVLQPGSYPRLRQMGINDRIVSMRPVVPPPPPPPPPPRVDGQITFYEFDGFHGRSFATRETITDFRNYGFNDAASSVVVQGERWMACDNVNFSGRCVVLAPGVYPSLYALGLNNRISSVRELRGGYVAPPGLYEPVPTPIVDWRPRAQERIIEVQVSSVRAVYGSPQQRCWVEREQVTQRADPGAGAVIGGLIGGILGHELAGKGSKNVGTVGGAVVGATIGATASQGYVVGSQNVQRCTTVPSQTPAYWDVMYIFRGEEHHVQMTNPPASGYIKVNEAGEPRG